MNIRLVAYRKATSAATSDTAYNLDLQEAPNISLNFQFADIKEPEKRKGNYSQTFKLPFTDNNNNFFQNWFNVNLETLVYSTRTKFDAILYVGSVPQFEGSIQLKAVYQKAQVYEIVLMSNTSDLFSVIGSKLLKDVFLNSDGNYTKNYNHYLTAANIEESWDGTSTSFVSVPNGNILQDSVSEVQRIMYPLSVKIPNFYYEANSNQFLNMSNVSSYTAEEQDFYMVDITQFSPAIQIKTLFQLIIARAGFSYTSTFLDGNYFGNLYMTTCNHLNVPAIPTIGSGGDETGFSQVGTTIDGFYQDVLIYPYWTCDDPNDVLPWSVMPVDQVIPIDPTLYTVPSDNNSLWNTTYNYFTKTDSNMSSINIQTFVQGTNVQSCNSDGNIVVEIKAHRWDVANSSIDWGIWYGQESQDFVPNYIESISGVFNRNMGINGMPVGESAVIVMRFKYVDVGSLGSSATIALGSVNSSGNFPQGAGCYTYMRIDWTGYGTNQYGKVVDIPSCIDVKLRQKDFLKDLIERFNLIILSDPDNANNLLIEPYNDYLSQGAIKHWTDKLDLSKEIIVKDTTSMQKQSIILQDLEDVDMWNKTIKDEEPLYNPYGKIDIQETNNEFASGELKNKSIFSSYINDRIYRNSNTQSGTQQTNMAVQYEYTYKGTPPNIENPLEATKPKLYYYSGSATEVVGEGDIDKYYLHRHITGSTNVGITEFETYPLCSPFEIGTSSGIGNLLNTTRSLYWNQAPPVCGDLTCFNYIQDSIVSLKSLYYEYWKTYLNSIYNEEARIMECYLNLNSVDIFNFKFNDEIFIKDTYWRILNISNYQVSGQASTKVTLIKGGEIYGGSCNDCTSVVGNLNGNNTLGPWVVWCPQDTPNCVPDVTAPNWAGIFADETSCIAVGGTPFTVAQNPNGTATFLCQANTGSLPINLKTLFAYKSIFTANGNKSLVSGKINSYNVPMVLGNDNNRYSRPLLPFYGNDIAIKYNTTFPRQPQITGESHKIILTGDTDKNTKGFAYVQGNKNEKKFVLPGDSNCIIRVKGIATVIGGNSTTYVVGSTEAFAYYTAFIINNTVSRQLGTAGGTAEFSLKESGAGSVCSLYIDIDGTELRFGLQDSQTDTKRVWELSVEIDVNLVPNVGLPFGTDYALYQNGKNILFENGNYLLWN